MENIKPSDLTNRIKDITSNSLYPRFKSECMPFEYTKGEKITDIDLFFSSSISYLTQNPEEVTNSLKSPYTNRIDKVTKQILNRFDQWS